MRLHLRLSPSEGPVPFDHLHHLTGALHKWLGPGNAEHDGPSLYSFGWLGGARARGGALAFPVGAAWSVSFWEADAARRALDGLLRDPDVAFGMRVVEARQAPEPTFSPEHRFAVDGAVLARRNRDDGGRDHLLWDDPAADAALTRTLRTKLRVAGLDGEAEAASVRYDRSYGKARARLCAVKGTRYKASVCPVVVAGAPGVARFAWLVGVGELTGCGFGALR